jgi:hypothetical protein
MFGTIKPSLTSFVCFKMLIMTEFKVIKRRDLVFVSVLRFLILDEPFVSRALNHFLPIFFSNLHFPIK